jgi:uncharacterized protein YcaQ
MASWLGLERVEVGERGDLAAQLERAHYSHQSSAALIVRS